MLSLIGFEIHQEEEGRQKYRHGGGDKRRLSLLSRKDRRIVLDVMLLVSGRDGSWCALGMTEGCETVMRRLLGASFD